MLFILLKSMGCLAVLMLFYKLCLENLSIHKFKRFYLLGALLVSATIPFITFIEYVEPQLSTPNIEVNHSTSQELLPTETVINAQAVNYLPEILWAIYGLGLLLFGLKFCINLFRIISKINKNEKKQHGNITNVLIEGLTSPHTFFKYIFLNKIKFKSNTIPKEVLLHEETHANQKHSLDILFIEFLQILFWFNPLLYFIKKDIKLNHEFLADKAVLKHGIDSLTYQETLLSFTIKNQDVQLANAINYSLIKKRFTIMKTQTSRKTIWFRSLLLLPVLSILLFSFSTTKKVEKDALPTIEYDKTSIRKEHAKKETNVIQDGATAKQISEYNRLAKKYNSNKESLIIKKRELTRIKNLYKLMTETQKQNAEPYPDFTAPPAPPTSPAPPAPPISLVPPALDKPLNTSNHIVSMAKKGANFYYNGNKITSDEAIELVSKNSKMNMSSQTNNGKSTVHLSEKGMTIINGKMVKNENPKTTTNNIKVNADSIEDLKGFNWVDLKSIFKDNAPEDLISLEFNYNQKVILDNNEVDAFNFKISGETRELNAMMKKAQKMINSLKPVD